MKHSRLSSTRLFFDVFIWIVFFSTVLQGKTYMYDSYTEKIKEFDHFTAALAGDWRAYFNRYIQHDCEDVRRTTYSFLWTYARQTNDIGKKRIFVELLAFGLSDQTTFVSDPIYGWLMDFSTDDFTDAARCALRSISYTQDPRIILLQGIAHDYSAREKLQNLIDPGQKQETTIIRFSAAEWNACLALSRWGDTDMLKLVLATVKKENELVKLATEYFPDLAYTQQNEAFDLLQTYLDSDQQLPALKENTQGIPLAYYAARVFATALQNFPISSEDLDQSDLPRVREWVHEQKEWSIKR